MKMNMIVGSFLLFITFTIAAQTSILNLKEVVMKELYNVKKQVAMECTAEHPVNNATIRQIMTHTGIPDEKEAKCWLSCVLLNMGIIKNGKVDWKKGAELSKMVLGSDEDKEKVDIVSEKCEKEVSQDEEDQCQLAYNTAICKFKYGKELGLPGGVWEE